MLIERWRLWTRSLITKGYVRLEDRVLIFVHSHQLGYARGVKRYLEALGRQVHELRQPRRVGMRELVRRMSKNLLFLIHAERGLVPAPEYLVRRVVAGQGVDANSSLI